MPLQAVHEEHISPIRGYKVSESSYSIKSQPIQSRSYSSSASRAYNSAPVSGYGSQSGGLGYGSGGKSYGAGNTYGSNKGMYWFQWDLNKIILWQ